MDERGGAQRVLVCGAPGAGKKAILDALAKHLATTMPTLMPILVDPAPEMPRPVIWEALFARGGRARFESFYGVGFRQEDAVVEQFSRPVSSVIYVLRQVDRDFLESDFEYERFGVHVAAANKFRRGWRDVPWLFVQSRSWKPDPSWFTELIPPELASSVIPVDAASGSGIPELSSAIDRMLMLACLHNGSRSC